MKKVGFIVLFLWGTITSLNAFAQSDAKPALPPSNFKSAMAHVNGINIHYMVGGTGEPLVLVHGFGQNWYMWNRLLPELSKHFTVIVPELRGIGESDKPEGGYDKKTMASDIHELVKQLGYKKIDIAGHDIGMMVAYAYAAQYGSEVNRLALLDAIVIGVEPIYSEYKAKAWWWGFYSWPASEKLVEGREQLFLENFWPVVGYVKNPFTEAEKAEFIRAYAVNGGTYGSFHWFAAFTQDEADNQEFQKHKLQMPVLAMGGDHSTGSFFADHIRVVADNVTGVVIKDAGHWLVQEQTDQVQKALLNFFLAK
jgi:pimeloyl-ACP methyl ester carboxylesterase